MIIGKSGGGGGGKLLVENGSIWGISMYFINIPGSVKVRVMIFDMQTRRVMCHIFQIYATPKDILVI